MKNSFCTDLVFLPSINKAFIIIIIQSWLHTKQHFNNATYSFELWRSHLKTIESHFGTGVTSYFLFLKALFLLNWPIFLLTFGFVVTPQIVFRYLQQSPPGYSANATFDGREIITGGVSLYFPSYSVNIGFISFPPQGVAYTTGHSETHNRFT